MLRAVPFSEDKQVITGSPNAHRLLCLVRRRKLGLRLLPFSVICICGVRVHFVIGFVHVHFVISSLIFHLRVDTTNSTVCWQSD